MVNCNCCRLELNFSRIRAQPTATIAPEAAKDGVQRLLSQWSSRKVDESTRSNLRSIGSLTTKRDVLESSFTKHIPICSTSTYSYGVKLIGCLGCSRSFCLVTFFQFFSLN